MVLATNRHGLTTGNRNLAPKLNPSHPESVEVLSTLLLFVLDQDLLNI